MYLLSFLLTADHDKAEQCLVSTIGEAPEGIGVFVDWTRLCARRTVIEHAIDLIVPAPEHADDVSRVSLTEPARWTDKIPFAAILLLDAFERFVFVMSILEGHSDEECAILLRCSRRDVMMARVLGSPASVKHGCKGPLEIPHRLRECMALECLTRNVD
jgi:hypothetical protein